MVAGVVGQSKFQYDIWGDTVNVAARMEANSEPDKINVSENIYQQLKEKLTFLYRGTIEVKNKGGSSVNLVERPIKLSDNRKLSPNKVPIRR